MQYRIPLHPAADARAELTFTPQPAQFGDVAVGQVGHIAGRLTNTGSVDVNGITLATRYPFSVEGSACGTLAVGASCDVPLWFTPGEPGYAADTLSIRAGTVSLDPILTGNGAALIADLEVSDGGGWNYGPHVLGTVSPSKTLTLRNTGDASLYLSNIGLLKGSEEYQVVHDCPAELAAGATCSVTVAFAPDTLGRRLGAFRVTAADGSIRDVWLLGYGVREGEAAEVSLGRLSVTPRVEFGRQQVPTGGILKTFSLTNTGSTAVELSALTVEGADASAFTVTSNCAANLSPYSACTASVVFTPTELRPYAAQIQLSAAAHEVTQEDGALGAVQEPTAHQVLLSGQGANSSALLVADPTAVDFETSPRNVPVQKTVTITNLDTVAQALSVSYATNPENFVVLGGCEGDILPGKSCTMQLLYQAYSPNRADGALILVARETGQTLNVPLTGAAPAPDVSLSTWQLTFGTVDVGAQSPAKKLVLLNQGLAPAQIRDIRINYPKDFTFDASACGGTIPAKGSCEVLVSFTPQASGARGAVLTVQTDDAQNPVRTVELRGTGQIGALSVMPTAINFGQLEAGSEASRTVLLGNQGPGAVRLQEIKLTGAGAAAYRLEQACESTVLAVGQTCEMTVHFSPTAAQGFGATLTLVLGEGLSSRVALSGFGKAPAAGVLTVLPDPVNAGGVSIDRIHVQDVLLKNTGTADLLIDSVEVAGADASVFSMQSETCLGVLAPQAKCQVTLIVAPKELRDHTASLQIQVRDQALRTVPLMVLGIQQAADAQLSVAPAFVDLGEVTPDVPYLTELTLSSTGTAPLTLTAPMVPAGLRLTAGDCQGTYVPGDSCTLQVQTKVSASATLNLELATSAGQRLTVPFMATVTPKVVSLAASPSSLDFGVQPVAGPAVSHTVQLTNTGNTPAPLAGIALQGVAALDYSLSSSCPLTLSVGQTCELKIGFVAQATGARAAHVVVTDGVRTLADITLTGQGQVAPGEPEPAPALTLTPTNLSFVATEVGKVAPVLQVQLTNTGSAALTISGIGLLDKLQFAQSNNCGTALRVGESCLVAVQFAPTAQGLQRDSLVILSDAANLPVASVLLSGYGWEAVTELPAEPGTGDGSTDPGDGTTEPETPPEEAKAQFTLNPSGLNFGQVTQGSSPSQNLLITNVGTAASMVGQFTLTGTQAQAFTVTASTCDVELAPTQSCTVSVAFTPMGEGRHLAQFGLHTPQGQALVASLQGTGPGTGDGSTDPEGGTPDPETPPDELSAQFTLSPSGLNFGQVTQGPSPSQNLLVTNVGTAASVAGQFALTGAQAQAFTVTASTCDVELTPTQSCTVSVAFTPMEEGRHLAQFELYTPQGQVLIAGLQGSGPGLIGQLQAQPTNLDFGEQALQFESSTKTVTLHNPGATAVSLTGVQLVDGVQDFRIVASGCSRTLAAGASCMIQVVATAAQAGQVAGTLRIYSTAEQDVIDVALTANVVTPAAEVLPTALEFGTVYVGAPALRAVQLMNPSALPLRVTGVSLAGGAGLSQSNDCADQVAPGATCEVRVRFAPAAAGDVTSSLVIATSAGTFTVPVTGTGAKVSLTSVSPREVPSAVGGWLTLRGQGFTTDAQVLIDGQLSSDVQWISASELRVFADPHAPGLVDVTVQQGEAPLTRLPKVLEFVATPEFAQFTPDAGTIEGGWHTTLTGSNLRKGMTVTIDGKAASVVVNSATQASITVPARAQIKAGPVDVVIISSGEITTLPGALTYTVPQAQLVLEGPSTDFGEIAQDAYYSRILTLRNLGESGVSLGAIDIVGDAQGVFSRIGGGCSTGFPVALAKGASCTIVVQALSSVLGAATATLRVVSDIPAAEVTRALSARVVPPDYSLSGTPGVMSLANGDFGVTPAYSEVGDTNAPLTKTVYLNNAQHAAGAQIQDAQVSLSGPDAAQFAIVSVRAASDSGAQRTSGQATVNPDGQSATGVTVDQGNSTYHNLAVTLRYAPATAGEHNVQMSITFNSGRVAGLPLFGQAKYFNEAQLQGDGNYGPLGYSSEAGRSTSGSRTFTVKSLDAVGKLLVVSRIRIIGADADAFAVTDFTGRYTGELTDPQDIAPRRFAQTSISDILSLAVRFTPQHLGAHQATLVLESNTDGEPLALDLFGEGARDVQLALSQGAGIVPLTDYPLTGIGASAIKDVYLRNTGTIGAVTYTGIQIVGSPAFTLTDYGRARGVTKTQVVAPENRARFVQGVVAGADAASSGIKDFYASIRFNPMTLGTHEATVTIWHDGPGGSTVFTLRGEGALAAAALSGTASVPATPADGDLGTASFNGAGEPTTQTLTRTFYVVNATQIGKLAVDHLAISGADADAFAIAGYTRQPAGFKAGQEFWPTTLKQSSSTEALAITVSYMPTAMGTQHAELVVGHDGMNESPLVLPLAGYGNRDVAFALSQGAGIVPVTPFEGSALGKAVTKTIFLRNVGSIGAARYLGFQLEGGDSFVVKAAGLGAQGSATFSSKASYAAGAKSDSFELVGADALKAPTAQTDLALSVQFTPISYGTDHALLKVLHDGPDGETSVDLLGSYNASALAFFTVADPEVPVAGVDFGDVGVSSESKPLAVLMRNAGNVPVTLTATLMRPPTGYALATDSICAAGLTLMPDEDCELRLVFKPTAQRDYASTWRLQDGAQLLSPSDLALAGQGKFAELEFWDESGSSQITEIKFPPTVAGKKSEVVVRVKSVGTVPLILAASTPTIKAPFSVSENACVGVTLVSGEYCTIHVVFAPTVYGATYEGADYVMEIFANTETSAVIQTQGTTPLPPFAEIVLGEAHVFARKADGTWWSTGRGDRGQLGDGGTKSQARFIQIPALTGVAQVAPGALHTYALQKNGTVIATGDNTYGQLGFGNNVQSSTFKLIPELTPVNQIFAGPNHGFVQKRDGSWWAAGVNSYGELGLGDSAPRLTFTRVSGLNGAVELVTSSIRLGVLYGYTFARKSDGTWWASGYNGYGNLGLGNTIAPRVFTQIPELTGATNVVGGGSYAFARKADGTWWATGDNSYGQLGLGDTVRRTSFTQVPALADAVDVVAGGSFTFVRKKDGTWWAVGYNAQGQLGLGDTVSRYTLTQVPALTGATQVLAGSNFTYARMADDTWWSTGNNAMGQLGPTRNRSKFAPVPGA